MLLYTTKNNRKQTAWCMLSSFIAFTYSLTLPLLTKLSFDDFLFPCCCCFLSFCKGWYMQIFFSKISEAGKGRSYEGRYICTSCCKFKFVLLLRSKRIFEVNKCNWQLMVKFNFHLRWHLLLFCSFFFSIQTKAILQQFNIKFIGDLL